MVLAAPCLALTFMGQSYDWSTQCHDNVTLCGIMSSVGGMILQCNSSIKGALSSCRHQTPLWNGWKIVESNVKPEQTTIVNLLINVWIRYMTSTNHLIGKEQWLAPCMIALFIILTPLWIYISLHNKYTNDVVYSGWTPVLSAMVISR